MKQSCCGVVEEARMQAQERRAQKPQSWIALKIAVGLTIALNGYVAYVYVGIFCRDMIVKNKSALGSQAVGIVFLTVFCILLLMVSWSYIMVVTTSPGHAKSFVERTERPSQPMQPSSTSDDTPGMSYELLSTQPDPSHNASNDFNTRTTRDDRHDRLRASPASGRNDTVTSTAAPAAPHDMIFHHTHTTQYQGTNTSAEVHVTDVLANPEIPHLTNHGALPSHAASQQTSSNPPQFFRQPRLLSEKRYCPKDEVIKPPRAHHCRACGTCILKYDHHCPWVGHCVGAFNHKFFVNFVQWAAILAFWIFATLLGLIVKSRKRSPPPDLDPQEIVIIALTAFFGIFCGLMFMTHVHLIMLNQTTVESMAFRTMKEREQNALAKMYNWYNISAKRQTKKNWDMEWGRIGKEGNLWWLGSRENWESVMGKNVWWWFLPVGYGLQNGLDFPTNPRFDKQGRLMRRREWPSDLQ